jgi:hypothetical protein
MRQFGFATGVTFRDKQKVVVAEWGLTWQKPAALATQWPQEMARLKALSLLAFSV